MHSTITAAAANLTCMYDSYHCFSRTPLRHMQHHCLNPLPKTDDVTCALVTLVILVFPWCLLPLRLSPPVSRRLCLTASRPRPPRRSSPWQYLVIRHATHSSRIARSDWQTICGHYLTDQMDTVVHYLHWKTHQRHVLKAPTYWRCPRGRVSAWSRRVRALATASALWSTPCPAPPASSPCECAQCPNYANTYVYINMQIYTSIGQ